MSGAIILGIVQGVTEFFPVSSTAHLVLFPWVFGWQGALNSLAFDVAVHLGTFLSLLICFYGDWINMLKSNRKLLLYIVAGTIPAGAAGLIFRDFVEAELRAPLVIASMLVLFGIVMLISERFGKQKGMDRLSLRDALFIGFAQAVALIPGVSRSGITISAGLFAGLKRDAAARFSFLLSMPVVFAATMLEGRRLWAEPAQYDFILFGAGLLTSLVSGVFAIKYLLKFLKRHSMNAFVYYRFVVALAIAGLVWQRG
jgi:undecaprenyl-diphosphatase